MFQISNFARTHKQIQFFGSGAKSLRNDIGGNITHETKKKNKKLITIIKKPIQ
jgi:ribosomal protein S17E